MDAKDRKLGLRVIAPNHRDIDTGKYGFNLLGTIVEMTGTDLVKVKFDDPGWSDAWRFAHDVEVAAPAAYPTINEHEEPCIQCSRKNFVTATKCWWCECPNPTQRRAS